VLREILYKNKFLLPDFASGIHFRLAQSSEYIVRANISRTSRIPTLNELYWYPGGNTDLNNEYAFIYELGYEMSQAVSKSLTFKYDITVYRNSIKDMIQWRPGEFSYWTAGNVRNVSTRGLETSVALAYSLNKVNGIFSAGYSYTRATDDNADEDGTGYRQMIYVPENQANASLRIKYGKLYTSWKSNMTGRRYTPAVLPSYFVNCLSVGFQINPSWGSLNVDFEIDNIFNTEYQTIAYYPLPGRSFGVKVLIQLIKLK
jgi:iron complex outermembrane receptor protein